MRGGKTGARNRERHRGMPARARDGEHYAVVRVRSSEQVTYRKTNQHKGDHDENRTVADERPQGGFSGAYHGDNRDAQKAVGGDGYRMGDSMGDFGQLGTNDHAGRQRQ